MPAAESRQPPRLGTESALLEAADPGAVPRGSKEPTDWCLADPGAVPRVDRSEARLTPGRRPGVPARGQPRSRPRLAPAVRLAAALLALAATPLAAQSRVILLATTTSTRDAGLLDSILPLFERQTGYRVKVVAVGSGQALALGRRGDADVVLAHAPEAERVLADSGYYVARRLVMHNEFLIVGPADDPAGVRGMSDAAAALRQIAERHAVFVSRGDESGTHKREKELWKKAGLAIPAPGPSYVEMGQGMGETLQAADEKRGYALRLPRAGAEPAHLAAYQRRGRQGARRFLRRPRHPGADRRVRQGPLRAQPVPSGRRQAGPVVSGGFIDRRSLVEISS